MTDPLVFVELGPDMWVRVDEIVMVKVNGLGNTEAWLRNGNGIVIGGTTIKDVLERINLAMQAAA